MPGGSKETREWTFEASKVNFTCHIRNCAIADESPANKYLPLYVQKEKLKTVGKYFMVKPNESNANQQDYE